ncbi:hypothetical protein BTN_1646 [Burkholderia thailandensis E254]|nr:hypothetical protein BTN_1646 [Burkholderia thailandensis E254]MUV20174.1 hypothetical protein [Burkholderia thailandensis]PNE69790.1 hypothetical protein A8H38_28390 [Burkholderia thailandensis]
MKTVFSHPLILEAAATTVPAASFAVCGGVVSPLDAISVDDGRNADWWGWFDGATKVASFDLPLRLAVQQSNCFVITSIRNRNSDARLMRITGSRRNSGGYRAGSK